VRDALKAGKLITGGFGVPMELQGVKSVTGHAYTAIFAQTPEKVKLGRWG